MNKILFVSLLMACSEPVEQDRPPKPPLDTDTTEETTDTELDTADSSGEPLDEAAEMCRSWNEVRASLSSGTWSGSVAGCNAGSYSQAGIDSTLASINLYREIADLPAVVDNVERNAAAQECSLMQQAAGYLNHYPDAGAPCYTASGASAAGKSNMATAESVSAVDMYMEDPGNSTTLGHRRWLLSNSLGPVGVGSASSASCLWVIGGSGSANKSWTAWPPPGPFPIQAVSASWSSIDSTGWSIQSDSINLNSAQVSVRSGGSELPVKVTSLLANYGSSYAISIIPQGWSSQAGSVYKVDVSGISGSISYEVELVDCDSI